MAAPHRKQRSADRLSDLPESVLTYLLSFLSTKQCVATSILSRRWRNLWKHVPVIRLDTLTEETICRFLLLHKAQSIDSFSLSLQADFSDYHIESWIIAAIERNVRQVNLTSSIINGKNLPSRLFTCESLVQLRLFFCGAPINLQAVYLPRLKSLSLVHFRFQNDESLTRLLSSCPILENLVVMDSSLSRCSISSPSIKRVRLYFEFYDFEKLEYRDGCRVELNTPALEDLLLKDGSYELIQSGPLPSLTKLELAANCLILFKLLESANNLQFLYFQVVDVWVQPQRLPRCLLSHLRTITLSGLCRRYSDADDGLEIVRYLLRNAGVLERMRISFHSDVGPEKKTCMLKDISLFERRSKTCEIDFS